jgi:hypothetical protein
VTTPAPSPNADASLGQDIRYAIRYYAGGRRGLLLLTAVALVAGAALNWSWLVAAGIAPLLLTLAPCAVMCALGLCMNRMGGRSCSSEQTSADRSADPTLVRTTPDELAETTEVLAEPSTEVREIPSLASTAATQQPQRIEERDPTNA